MNNTQTTLDVIKAAMDAECKQMNKTEGSPIVDLDKTESSSVNKPTEKGMDKCANKSADVNVDQIRADLHLTQSDDDNDDFELSDSSSIVMTKVARKEEMKAAAAEPKQSKGMKRPAIIPLGQPRVTKRRLAELQKIREEANNTFERNEKIEKTQNGWRKQYEKRTKRRINLKLKTGQEVQVEQLDNPADPQFHVNLNKRFEIRPKEKLTEDSEEVRQLKEQLAECQRQLAISQRKVKESELHVTHLMEKIEVQARTTYRLLKGKEKIVRPEVEICEKETQTEKLQKDKKIQVDGVLSVQSQKEDREVQVDCEKADAAAQSETPVQFDGSN